MKVGEVRQGGPSTRVQPPSRASQSLSQIHERPPKKKHLKINLRRKVMSCLPPRRSHLLACPHRLYRPPPWAAQPIRSSSSIFIFIFIFNIYIYIIYIYLYLYSIFNIFPTLQIMIDTDRPTSPKRLVAGSSSKGRVKL